MHAAFRGRKAARLGRWTRTTVIGTLLAAPPILSARAAGPAAAGSAATIPAAIGEREIAGTGPEADYLRAVHVRLHKVWHDQYLPTVSALDRLTAQRSSAHQPSPPSHGANEVTIGVEIRWDGSIAGTSIVRSSGDSAFDQAAVAVLRTAAPLPVAAHNLLSDDGYLHLTWTLARDERACSAGARFFRADDALDVALPRLLAAHRFDESVRRVASVPEEEREAATDRLARLWLALPVPSAQADVRAAAALARLGDRRQEARLRAGLALPLTAVAASEGLANLGSDICEAITPLLRGGRSAAAQAALAVLESRAARDPQATPCATLVDATVTDASINAGVRAHLVPWIARDRGPAWKSRYTELMADKSPAVRGAALLASAKRGGGRPEMYRLVEHLHDPAIEVRAAASAALVRVAGDQALDQLYLLTREKDARPYEAVSAELAAYATPATAEFLGKLLKHGGPAELPAARALAARHDAAARALIDPFLAAAAKSPTGRAELRALAEPGSTSAGEGGAEQQQYRALLASHHVKDAASWLLSRLADTEPVAAVPLLCDWLDRGRAVDVTSKTGGSSVAAPSGEQRLASSIVTP